MKVYNIPRDLSRLGSTGNENYWEIDMSMDTGRLTYTVDEASIMLGLSRNSAYEGVARGDIPSIRVGRRLLIPSP